MSFLKKESPNEQFLSDPDVLLMLEFQKGNQAAFEALMRKYYRRVLNFIYRFCANEESAEDLTQEVFIKVYRQADKYTAQSKFQTWLFTIAKNLALNELRRPHYRQKKISIDEGQDDQPELKMDLPAPKRSRPDYEILQQEKARAVQKAIAALPENQRIAVLLRRYEDFSYEEIAQALNCSVEAVKSILNRAKNNLKDLLKDFIQDQ